MANQHEPRTIVGTPQLSRHFGANCQSVMAEIALNVPLIVAPRLPDADHILRG